LSGRLLSEGNFTYVPKPAGIMDMGVVFDQVVDKTSGNKVIAMDTYFVPSVNIWNNSYVDITYPDEIKLPINF